MPKPLIRLLGVAPLAGLALAASARAEDISRDRAEFDAALRGYLLQPTPVADSVPTRGRRVERPPQASPSPSPERRTVRVVLPSPYGR
jgi:hypothetical protein